MSARIEDQQGLRHRAEESLNKKLEFWTHLLAYVLINGVIVAIWAMTGADFFWPAFPIAGWGIGLAFHAWDVYIERPPSEERIRREMDRLARQH
ncbi:MAG TPA: 2TM domain-containing protein [Actinomycetota bacterium]